MDHERTPFRGRQGRFIAEWAAGAVSALYQRLPDHPSSNFNKVCRHTGGRAGNAAMNPANLFDVFIKCSKARELMGLWEEVLCNAD